MPEAYEVGITLALQDGVSAGIQLIQRDLALLDRAIAATSQNLTALGARGGMPKSGPAMAASPGSAADEFSRATKSVQNSVSDSSDLGPDTGSKPASPPAAPAPGSLPGAAASTMGRQAADAGSSGPTNTGVLQRPAAPVEQTGAAVAQQAMAAATVNGSASEAAVPGGGTEATTRQPRSVAPVETAPVPVTPNPQRRIGPVLPSELPPRLIDASGATGAPMPMRREPAAEKVSVATSAAPVENASKLDSRAARQKSEPDAANPSLNRAHAPAPQAQSSQMSAPESSMRQQPNREPTTPLPLRYSSTSRAPEVREQTASAPLSEPTRDGGGQPQSAAAAPSAAAPQAVTMQGDIIIDGTRLGRWMTNALARQASRPSSGPVAPDPRQTPLWSGQAQGF